MGGEGVRWVERGGGGGRNEVEIGTKYLLILLGDVRYEQTV